MGYKVNTNKNLVEEELMKKIDGMWYRNHLSRTKRR